MSASAAADLDADVRASGRTGGVAQQPAADGQAVSAAEESALVAGASCISGEAGEQAGAEGGGGERQQAAGEPRRKLMPVIADMFERDVVGIRGDLGGDAECCERACNLLHKLLVKTTSHNRHAARLAEAGIIPRLLSAMRRFSANRGVVDAGLDTLHQLASRGCEDAVAEAGGAAVVGEAMDAFVEDAELQAECFKSPLLSVPAHVQRVRVCSRARARCYAHVQRASRKRLRIHRH